MRIVVNGEAREAAEGSTLADVLSGAGVPERGVAVAVDDQVVRRADWPRHRLTEGARVEVLTAVQGG